MVTLTSVIMILKYLSSVSGPSDGHDFVAAGENTTSTERETNVAHFCVITPPYIYIACINKHLILHIMTSIFVP